MGTELRQGVSLPFPPNLDFSRTFFRMLTGYSMRRLMSATAGILLAGAPISRALTRTPACPLVVEGLRRQGMAVQVVMRNQAPYAVNKIVIHLTFTDAAHQTHQLALPMNQTVAQHLTTVYTTPPITGSIVLWPTLAVTMECHMVRH